ncbi:MAG: TIGR00341 family protein [Cyanobacteriota bacterium]|nr:TIGR00341 family protein [Cyanobacteriota bacterium]
MKYFVRKHFFSEDSHFIKFWNQHSGDWHWLEDKQRSIASINRHLWRLSVPSPSFHFLLALSGVIATLGLLANSVAVIIGAMIVAPLMGPIIGIAYAMVVGNRRLLRRSLLTLSTGTILTISISLVTAYLVGLKTLSPEILARVNPTSIDLGVALAAGAAGAFANSRRHIADALPGVAIAVALVPPLSVVGIGLALGEGRVATGAMLLFVTNLTGIVFSGGVVFLFQRYGTLAKAKRGLLVSVALLSILGLPLGFSLRRLLIRENVRRSVGELIRRRTVTFSETDVRAVRASPQPEGEGLQVELEVAAPPGSISNHQVHLVRDFLARELKVAIALEVQVVPVEVLQAPANPRAMD